MNELNHDALIHILTRLPKDDLSAFCCTAQNALDEHMYMLLFRQHFFEKMKISSWKSAFHSLNNIVSNEECTIWRIYEVFKATIARFLDEDSQGTCNYEEGYYLHGSVHCLGLYMHIHQPVGGDSSWDGNAHPAKYGIE